MVSTIVILFAVLVSSTVAQKNPNFVPNRSTIVHLFEWKWSDIAKECEGFLKEKGYGGVQISPPNENKIIDKRPWYERYQPVSYKIATRSGNEQEFLDMSRRCNKAGIRIYADIVINHMAAGDSKTVGTAGTLAEPNSKSFPAVPYTAADFHPTCTIQNYKNADEIRKCELVGLKDLDHSKPHVREVIVNYLNHLVDLGVAGFRVDAAKHMFANDLGPIYKAVKNLNTSFGFAKGARPYVFQEVIDLGGEPVTREQYIPHGAVIEFRYGNYLANKFRGKESLKSLENWGPKSGLLPNPKDSLVFIDNHDNERGHGAGGSNIITYKDKKLFNMANAFMLAHPYGVARVLSNYDFKDASQGPPADTKGNILSPNPTGSTCANGWMCEHRWRQIYNMVGFRNAVKGTQVENFWSGNDKQIAFCRGNKGFVAFTIGGELKGKLKACVPPGSYCDVISGEVQSGKCTGKVVKVAADGTAEIDVPANDENGMLAIHVGSKIKS